MYKTLEEYKRLPYTLRTEPIDDPEDGYYWLSEYIELQGCKTEGNTEAEAVANLYELFDEYISTMIKNNSEIPLPIPLPKRVTEVREVVFFLQERGLIEPGQKEMRDSRPTGTETKPETKSVTYEEIEEHAAA
jgi:predicted RNase H-like HicB family nuclease